MTIRSYRGLIYGPLTLVALVALVTAAACSSDGTSTAPSSASGSFPVSIEHKFGTTEISQEPQRVLSLGYQEHDVIFAFGVTPIAARYWFGDESDVIFPWAEDEAGGADPEILNMSDGINFEKIAALQPDLILGVYSGMTERDYELLSQIAPTVAQTGEYIDYGTPWDVQTLTVGRALGREDRARELVAAVETRFEALRREHPEFSERSVVVATPPADGPFGTFASEDPRARFFTSLGFQVPARIDELAGDSFYATISPERADLLDADLLVWDQLSYLPGGRAAIEANPLVQQLGATQEGRVIYLDGDLEYAFAFNTVLSLPFLLDGIEPMLEAATDGDPATTN
ncbi:MAG: iron-siderophore ABC transporter substrate-binding protein [Nocardioidaceae bacterium]